MKFQWSTNYTTGNIITQKPIIEHYLIYEKEPKWSLSTMTVKSTIGRENRPIHNIVSYEES